MCKGPALEEAQPFEHQKGGPGDRIMENDREIMATCWSLQHCGALWLWLAVLDTMLGEIYNEQGH